MRKKYLYSLGVLSLFSVTSLVQAQTNYSNISKKIREQHQKTERKDKSVVPVKSSGSFYKKMDTYNLSKQEFLNEINSWLNLNEHHTFEQVTEKTDELGITHIGLKQYFKGVEVENFRVFLHLKNGKLTSVNGRIGAFNHTKNKEVIINKDEALTIAKNFLGVSELIQEYPIETVIFNNDSYFNDFLLAQRVRIDSESPFEMCYVYVDASTGKIINKVNLVAHADVDGSGKTFYRGLKDLVVGNNNGTYQLRDESRKIATFDATLSYFMGDAIANASDYESTSSFFGSKRKLENLTINISNNWWNSTATTNNSTYLYIKIKNADSQTIYRSLKKKVYNENTVVFTNLTAFLEPNKTYQVELWKSSPYQDSYGGVFTINTQNQAETNWSTNNGNNGTYLFVSAGNPATDVHWGMQKTYDFYSTVFNRNSFDNNNSTIKQYVNPPFLQYRDYTETSPNNAVALPAPYSVMAYGLGDGSLLNPVVALDVEGHEYTHLVVENNGNGGLAYLGESGALNESFADIFGTNVEFFVDENPNWEIGENVVITAANFRSMSNPNNPNGLSKQPDTYLGNYWVPTHLTNQDNGGVHTNSGVQNFWFYLLSEGGSGVNDNGDSYNVTAIGMEQARKIAFRNLTNYLSPNATYFDAHAGSLQAAEDLYGAQSPQYNAVVAAWHAVGIGEGVETSAGCEPLTVLTEPSGAISDGSGNENYLNNRECVWDINPPGANQITITFTEFDLENGYDFVKVVQIVDDEPVILADLTGNIDLPYTVSTSEGIGRMIVAFMSDEAYTAQGWSAYYSSGTLKNPNFEIQNKLSIYPNPSNGIFEIASEFDEILTAQLYDATGKQLFNLQEISKGLNQIDISHLASGVYWIKFQKGKEAYSEKIVIK